MNVNDKVRTIRVCENEQKMSLLIKKIKNIENEKKKLS